VDDVPLGRGEGERGWVGEGREKGGRGESERRREEG
jgi:hypothetical protein